MSNDNKTLADVQPGGRVRLGDQAERARFEAWAHAQSYRGGNIMADRDAVHPDVYADPIAQLTWKSWQAALSAQPSPGGQDALDCIGRIEEAIEFRVPHDIYAAVHGELAELKAALAARQPVGQIDEAAVLRRAADVLYMWEDDPNLTGHMGDFKDACDILEVLAQNAAQPAQAVDLGQSIPSELAPVAAALKRFGDCAEDSGSEGCDIGRDWFDALTTIGLLKRTQRSPAVWTMTAEGERLLALVNGKAVGNG